MEAGSTAPSKSKSLRNREADALSQSEAKGLRTQGPLVPGQRTWSPDVQGQEGEVGRGEGRGEGEEEKEKEQTCLSSAF